MIRIDFNPAIDKLREEFKDRLSPLKIRVALGRALNRTAAKAKTEAYRTIRMAYNIPAKNIRNDITIQRANQTSLVARLNALGRPLPLSAFSPSQTKKGVTVKIGTKRVLVRGAFKATMPNGHSGIFARGTYAGKSFAFRKERAADSPKPDLAINELYSKSVPTALLNNTVLDSMKKRMLSDLPQRARHELNYILSQGRGGE